MNNNDRYWDEQLAMAYLRDAAGIHRRLPPVKVPTYRTLWPETLKDDWTRLYDMVNGRTNIGSPYPAEVTYSEEIMAWLRWLDRHHQQVVWMRANRIPWKIITEELDRAKTTLWHDMRSGLNQIASRLDVHDPQGEHFSHLRNRANGVFEHS